MSFKRDFYTSSSELHSVALMNRGSRVRVTYITKSFYPRPYPQILHRDSCVSPTTLFYSGSNPA